MPKPSPANRKPLRLLQKLKKRNEPNSQGRAASRTGAARLINPKIPSKLAFDSLPTPQLRSVGQALGLRRPLRPPGPPFNNLRSVFDRARVLQDPLLLTCPALSWRILSGSVIIIGKLYETPRSQSSGHSFT